jgi:hypothetical protein
MTEQEIFQTLGPFVHPIVRATGPDTLEFVGSGFLLKTSEMVTLITAAHVLDHHDGECSPLFLPTEYGTIPIQGTSYSSAFTDGATRRNDKFDVAAIMLEQGICEKLAGVSCVSSEMLHLTDINDPALPYVAIGFPVKKADKRIDYENKALEPELYGFITDEADSSKYEKLGVARDSHLAINFEKKNMFFSSGVKKGEAPNLNGLSGSPIWGLLHKSETELKAVIVAVLTEHHQGSIKAVLGTRLSAIPKQLSNLSSET